jgi:predicted SAM-dependent methyltransferase
VKLNLGCGGDVRTGYDNIDLYVSRPGVIKADAAHLPYDPGTVEEIIAIDVLEHFSHREIKAVLGHWCALLQPGGTLIVRCPDARKQAELLLAGFWPPETFSYMVYGGQDSPGNFHKACFTMELLIGLIESNGLRIEHREFLHSALHPEIARSSNPNLLIQARKVAH